MRQLTLTIARQSSSNLTAVTDLTIQRLSQAKVWRAGVTERVMRLSRRGRYLEAPPLRFARSEYTVIEQGKVINAHDTLL
jgi:hypothetical protein